jgi:hypothetical protein
LQARKVESDLLYFIHFASAARKNIQEGVPVVQSTFGFGIDRESDAGTGIRDRRLGL